MDGQEPTETRAERDVPPAPDDGPETIRVSFPGELDEDDLVEERPSHERGPEPSSPPPEAIWGMG